MKIAVFAAGEVGLKIVSLFFEKKKELTCLVLDSNGEGALNNQIQKIGASKNILLAQI
jgi:hypothetical protein